MIPTIPPLAARAIRRAAIGLFSVEGSSFGTPVRAKAAEKSMAHPRPRQARAGPSFCDVMIFSSGQPDARPRRKASTGRRSPVRIYRVFRPTRRPAATRARPKSASRGEDDAVFGRAVSAGAAGAGAGGGTYAGAGAG